MSERAELDPDVIRTFSHDLRATLTPIALWVHLAQDPAITPGERLARLRTIEGLVKRADEFMSKLPGLLKLAAKPAAEERAAKPAAEELAPHEDATTREDRGFHAISNVVWGSILLMRSGGDLTIRVARAAEVVRILVSGTGPELAGPRMVVEAQGGAVQYEGATKDGSAFSFTVPAAPGVPLQGMSA